MRHLLTAAALAALALPHAFAATIDPAAEPPCAASSFAVTGTIRDSTLALIPGATVTIDAAPAATSGPDGRFRLPCLMAGPHRLAASAPGFAPRSLDLNLPHPAALDLVLQPEAVESEVNVNAETDVPPSSNSAGPAQTLSGKELQRLADDPDDLMRELQQLAAATGGNPSNTTISVDGFQGSSSLPPKSSIAYIKINPDQFSAEYREPPFDGGRVEIYTKPGQKAFHGALFTTNGSPFENARDPFSGSKAAIGKQRYGLELSGPIRKVGSDFALSLEHRSIDNFAVVDAFNASGPITANVATPQRLWLATARADWQLTPKNTFIASYSANVNNLLNLGVGGTTLAEAGYNSSTYEHMFRVSNITTASAHLMHEARLSLRFDGSTDAPLSTAPQIAVSGAFTGGGASLGAQQIKELNIEADDDFIYTSKNHTLKAGVQLMTYIEHQRLTSGFNGAYVFTNLAQYQAGTPYEFSAVTGSPTVDFTNQRHSFFAQDDWNIGHGVHIAYGLRYFAEINPTNLAGVTPRLGVLWSPGKKGTWTLHAHAGMFTGQLGSGTFAEVLREDGISRHTGLAYNPAYCTPSPTCTPLAGTSSIQSIRQFSPHISDTFWSAENIGGTRAFPHGWNLSADLYAGRIWNEARTVNVNSPLNGQPNGPRPGAANLNILQVQNSGQDTINAVFMGLEQHTLKRVQFFFGGVHVNIIGTGDNSPFASPQSAYSDAGEIGRRSGQTAWNLFGNGTLNLPAKLKLSTDFNAGGDSHYNITTGFDNNGDGIFNDRPQYAAPGTPGAIQTPYGLLVANGGSAVFPRNKGVLPWTFHVDTNLQRAFDLTHNKKAEHQQTLTLNIRSSNVINHLNVTAIGGVLGSPLFNTPYAADNGRRIEAGARYAF